MISGRRNTWSQVAGVMMAAAMVWALAGCATTRQLDDVEAKADRALQMAQEAQARADRAENAAVRAEQAAAKAEAIAAKMEDKFMHKMQK